MEKLAFHSICDVRSLEDLCSDDSFGFVSERLWLLCGG